MARKDKHRWIYNRGQIVLTPLGEGKIIAITPKSIEVEFTNPPKDGFLFKKFYLEPTYEHQARISDLKAM